MKLTPLFDKIIIEFAKEEETTSSGIVLTGSSKEKPQFATVVAVGPGGTMDGKEITMVSKVGDKVVCSQYAGDKIKLEDKEYVIVKQSDIIAKID